MCLSGFYVGDKCNFPNILFYVINEFRWIGETIEWISRWMNCNLTLYARTWRRSPIFTTKAPRNGSISTHWPSYITWRLVLIWFCGRMVRNPASECLPGPILSSAPGMLDSSGSTDDALSIEHSISFKSSVWSPKASDNNPSKRFPNISTCFEHWIADSLQIANHHYPVEIRPWNNKLLKSWWGDQIHLQEAGNSFRSIGWSGSENERVKVSLQLAVLDVKRS